MPLSNTDYIAGYAAVVASCVAVWDFIKWKKSGPLLKVTIVEDGGGNFRINVANVGDSSTTIKNLYVRQYKRNIFGLRGQPIYNWIYVNYGSTDTELPHIIEAGTAWQSGIVGSDDMLLSKGNIVCIFVGNIHKDVECRVKEISY